MPLPAGTRLGSYEVLAPLGAGGMGEVYRARDRRLGREVAIKVLPPDLVADAESRRRFLWEAQAVTVLIRPHIAIIQEIDDAQGVPFIAMELIAGQDLGEKLARERLEPKRALDLALEVAEALVAAHDKAIVHRDLKPANVMLTEDGHVKIIDFGLARPSAAVASPDDETDTREDTTAGSLIGSVAYMSPEQVRRAKLDHRTDLWSFGVMLHEMLAGGRPFKGSTGADVLGAILRDPVPRLPALGPRIASDGAAEIQRVVDRCTAKDRTDRYAPPRHLLADLRVARRLAGGEAAPGDPPLPLAAAPPDPPIAPGMRKTVTALVSGVAPPAQGTLDPERRRRLAERAFETAAPVLRRHGALVERVPDGRVMGLFGVPVAHEDDALRAVRAAVELSVALAAAGVAVAVGIDTGEVLTGNPLAGEPLVMGDAVDAAEALARGRAAGEIGMGDATRRLVRDAVAAA